MATEKELIDALNMICEHVANLIPPGFSITLTMDSRESFMEMTDSRGNVVDADCHSNYSKLSAFCDVANEQYDPSEDDDEPCPICGNTEQHAHSFE